MLCMKDPCCNGTSCMVANGRDCRWVIERYVKVLAYVVNLWHEPPCCNVSRPKKELVIFLQLDTILLFSLLVLFFLSPSLVFFFSSYPFSSFSSFFSLSLTVHSRVHVVTHQHVNWYLPMKNLSVALKVNVHWTRPANILFFSVCVCVCVCVQAHRQGVRGFRRTAHCAWSKHEKLLSALNTHILHGLHSQNGGVIYSLAYQQYCNQPPCQPAWELHGPHGWL